LCIGTGVQALSGLTQATAVDDLDLLSCDHAPAWSSLLRSLPRAWLHRDPVPWHELAACVASEDPAPALAAGRYEMVPVMHCDPADNALTLARHLPVGTQFFWAVRDPEAAASEWRDVLDGAAACAPQCGLLFNCIARGPGFYGGRDRDWQRVRERFPRMPFAGFYGNGEIAWRGQDNRLLQYASVLALMKGVD
jgi:small ligand-binding sensory domain FIST